MFFAAFVRTNIIVAMWKKEHGGLMNYVLFPTMPEFLVVEKTDKTADEKTLCDFCRPLF